MWMIHSLVQRKTPEAAGGNEANKAVAGGTDAFAGAVEATTALAVDAGASSESESEP